MMQFDTVLNSLGQTVFHASLCLHQELPLSRYAFGGSLCVLTVGHLCAVLWRFPKRFLIEIPEIRADRSEPILLAQTVAV